MIPTVNLDDRTFDEIKNEAIRLIPRYCPEWTNHNPSDPGITLIELFSWMTEMTLYRLNKVPSKTYLAMLELMGLSLTTPQSARAPIQFFPIEGFKKNILIKAGTKVASISSEGQPIIFETENDLKICSSTIKSCINREGEKWTEEVSENLIQQFNLFDAKNSVEHILYISSYAFKYLEEGHSVQISFEPISEILSVNDEIINHLFWEYWNGRAWVPIESFPSVQNIKKQDDVIYLKGPIDIKECEVNGTNGLFIRAVLSDIPENKDSLCVKSIKLKTIFSGEGFAPNLCFSNSGTTYTLIDMNSSFRLFSANPSFNEMFYISADEILKNVLAKVKLTYIFSESYVPDTENENALFSYEYWNGTDWAILNSEQNDFLDGTFGFKQSGTVSFKVPKDIAKNIVNNEEHFWLRVRLITKDFSVGGTYSKDKEGNWIWHFNSKVQSPIIGKIRITYNTKQEKPETVLSCSNFRWINNKGLCNNSKDEKEVVLFNIEKENLPSLYIGFSEKIPEGDFSLYVRVGESKKIENQQSENLFKNLPILEEKNKQSKSIVISWEYWNGFEWKPLDITDGTDSFYNSGFINFLIPSDIACCELFNKNCFWLRVVKISGSFEKIPIIESILTNVVYAKNEDSYYNEVVGSGSGAPCQIYNVSHVNLLPGLTLCVDEGSIPSENELEMMKVDGIEVPYVKNKNSVWVKYKEVPNFYNSNSFSRHFVVDYTNGQIQFGDGVHGAIPPKGKFNIKVDSYKVGGGSGGNVAAHKIQYITQTIPYIEGCDNPYAAEGGSDMETIENLKSRAAGVFKSLDRAVTSEDFQWLAREASASVGRAFCLNEKNLKGEICTIIIPEMEKDSNINTKLVPSRELIRKVKNYLEERKLVGTRICVQSPIYRDFDIHLSLVFKTSVFDYENEKQKISEQLHLYFHSLFGSDGKGWEFGKYVTIGAILKQIEKVPTVFSINKVEIYDIDASVTVERLMLKQDELPFLNSVSISERRDSE